MSGDYVWPLPDGIPSGSRATIKGIPIVDVSSTRFHVNLLTKVPHDGKGDCAYHAAFHYNPKCVVYNTQLAGKNWEKEERHYLPLDAGKPFEIILINEANKFSLYLNGNLVSNFEHRMSVENIRCLTVEKCVKLISLSIDKIKSISWFLPNGFGATDVITITGFPGFYNSSGKFEIRLQNSPANAERDDVPFSMTVRFPERKIINNTYASDAWGKEETRFLKSQLTPEKEFEIAISRRDGDFKVFVNNEESYEYEMRVQSDEIKYLVIADDVKVTSVDFTSPKIDPRRF